MIKSNVNYERFHKMFVVFILLIVSLVFYGCNQEKIDSLTLSESEIILGVDGKETITAEILPKESSDIDIKWSSSDDNIAIVEDGIITAVEIGNATITVKAGNKTATVEVIVTDQTYNIIFNTNEGSEIDIQVVAHGEKATKPDEPTKEGYIFEGWYTAPNLVEEFDFGKVIFENTIIYANWEPINIKVTFDTNGGTEVSSIEKVYGSKILEADLSETPTKLGYKFAGWFLDEDLTVEVDFDTTLTDELTLYAKWNADEYNIEFETNGGSELDSITVSHGDKLTAPEDPTKNGYIFAGWFIDEDLNTTYNFDEEINKEFILFAKWDIGQSVVSFETNGGTEVENMEVTTLDKLGEPDVPTKEGYLFTGWFIDENLLEEYDFDKSVEGDFVLYAKWSLDPELSNKIDFELNGGSFPISSTDDFIIHGTPILCSFNNIVFNGSPWAAEFYETNVYISTTVATGSYWVKVGLNKNEMGLYEVTGIIPDGSIDMDAYDYVISAWPQALGAFDFATFIELGQIVTVTGFDITVVETGIIEGGSINVYAEDSAFAEKNANLFLDGTELPKPQKEGFTFGGWYITEDFSGDEVTVATDDGTLHAKWIPVE